MLNILRKGWVHLLVWTAMIVYLVLAPNLYANYFIKNGKPIQFREGLPAVTDQISYSVSSLVSTMSDGQEIYNLWGWAFLHEEADQSQYERFIVLKSDKRDFFFPVKSFERPEVQKAFPDLKIDVTNSGFSTYISKDAISPGSYRIGIVFRNKLNNAVSYVETDKMLTRTPNQLKLEIADLRLLNYGKPIQFREGLPAVTDQISYSIDRLDSIESDRQGIYNLWGWAFLHEEADQSQYERFIVLKSDKRDFFFPVKSFERPEVQKAFPDLKIDVTNSGFSTYISKDAISPGSYRIGIVFRNKLNNFTSYVSSNKMIINDGKLLQLKTVESQP